uniref:Uncharacterized protein n=1 Tax=Klebsiella pneumoniae TaxID=573 RepID=A0A8B0SPA5_KLEPN|nr:hypothetical protein [Klebsiella pneumoniae]
MNAILNPTEISSSRTLEVEIHEINSRISITSSSSFRLLSSKSNFLQTFLNMKVSNQEKMSLSCTIHSLFIRSNHRQY